MIHVIIIMIIIIVIYSSIVETGGFSFSLWKCRKKFYVDIATVLGGCCLFFVRCSIPAETLTGADYLISFQRFGSSFLNSLTSLSDLKNCPLKSHSRKRAMAQLCSSLEASEAAEKPLSCSFLMCFFRSKLRQKPLPQVAQVKGFLSLCVCMWKVRL